MSEESSQRPVPKGHPIKFRRLRGLPLFQCSGAEASIEVSCTHGEQEYLGNTRKERRFAYKKPRMVAAINKPLAIDSNFLMYNMVIWKTSVRLMTTPSSARYNSPTPCITKNLESANSMFSFIWWVIGFYWVLNGGQTLLSSSPRLYWLCVSFLVFDVAFIIVCVSASCLVGIAVCCFLACIRAILYAVTDQDGATYEEIDRLPKFKFRRVSNSEKVNGEVQASEGFMTECDTNAPTDHPISQADAECCVCLSVYKNGAELSQHPCQHHFHCTCIDKWLHINATCPMCKFNILKPRDRYEIGQV
ncbi:E3 ubiquitin-protein ligase At4g11680-like isoform X2 [Malus sylvestris]|uniref:E3 ubiquitin-protein ligase At4g11680-like isoform X2 n=1 Tax=Malus sylvestris TaxID=3752 RepID=UPI0021ACA891|nr:E3 ubiquitin-protein ligase At4g11680-like isoform X2 [Malus sylvestris]